MKRLLIMLIVLIFLPSCKVVKDIFKQKERAERKEIKDLTIDRNGLFENENITIRQNEGITRKGLHIRSWGGRISISSNGELSILDSDSTEISRADERIDTSTTLEQSLSRGDTSSRIQDRSTTQERTQKSETEKSIEKSPSIKLFIGIGILITILILVMALLRKFRII